MPGAASTKKEGGQKGRPFLLKLNNRRQHLILAPHNPM
jgi:hypothetical protein